MLIDLELSKEDEAAVGKDELEVRREDQDKINKFSRLHQRETTLEDELKIKAVWSAPLLFVNAGMTDERCRRTRKILRNCRMSWSSRMKTIESRMLCAELLYSLPRSDFLQIQDWRYFCVVTASRGAGDARVLHRED